MSDYIIRETKPGEPSLVASFYFKLFEEQFDFLPVVEKYFLNAIAELYDDPDSKLWIAEENGEIKGSICVIKKGEGEAQLRIYGTHPSTQGKGLGQELFKTAMDYCEEKGFRHLYLWTIDICKAAVHLYDKAGFKLTETMKNTTWADYEMTEEKWEYFAK